MTEYRVGIDTSLDLLADVQPGLTVLQDAVDWMGGRPAFVYRAMGRGGGASTPLSTTEARALLGAGYPVLPGFNDSSLNGGATGTYALGAHEGQKAIAQAQALGVPAGVYIPLDIELTTSDPRGNTTGTVANYLLGWCDAMRPSVYGGVGILYGILSAGSFLAEAVTLALADPAGRNVHRLWYWQSDWTRRVGFSLANTPPWAPDITPALAGLCRIWQVSGNDFNDIVDQDLIDAALLAPGAGLWADTPVHTGATVPAPAAQTPAPAPAAPQQPTAPAGPQGGCAGLQEATSAFVQDLQRRGLLKVGGA